MSENKKKTREEIIRQDVKELHGLGYAQQLFREMGGFSNFAISFSIISILPGHITITAGINVAAAIYLVGFISKTFGIAPDTAFPLFGTVTSWSFYIFVMVLIMIPQVLINIFGIEISALLSDISVYWHIGGGFIIALLLTFFGKYHNPASFVFSAVHTVNPLDASSVVFPDGTTGPALVIGTLVLKSPL